MVIYTDKHRIPIIISSSDWESVSRYCWHIAEGYMSTTIHTDAGQRSLPLHTFLVGPAPLGLQCDHRNRNKLDNRRSNLRFVTPSVNKRNTGVRSDSRSGIKGVYRVEYPYGIRWRVEIGCDNIGSFKTKEEAIQARKRAEHDRGYTDSRIDD